MEFVTQKKQSQRVNLKVNGLIYEYMSLHVIHIRGIYIYKNSVFGNFNLLQTLRTEETRVQESLEIQSLRTLKRF